MAELMAKTNHPNDTLLDAYEQWSQGGWGSILTGTFPTHPHTSSLVYNR
jgi:2,4-dienoyl-CoA reductase-like NADH-dependent reductase (Old Yellow Enzyme family)